jgi:hypothetical protein
LSDKPNSTGLRQTCSEHQSTTAKKIITTSQARPVSSEMNPLYRTTRVILRPSTFVCQLIAPQVRHASILGDLRDVPEAYNKRIRRGRGPSSGKGKTSGRGHKGQKQHGKVPAGFAGGQTPLEKVHGVRGFKNVYVHSTLQRGRSWRGDEERSKYSDSSSNPPRRAAHLLLSLDLS